LRYLRFVFKRHQINSESAVRSYFGQDDLVPLNYVIYTHVFFLRNTIQQVRMGVTDNVKDVSLRYYDYLWHRWEGDNIYLTGVLDYMPHPLRAKFAEESFRTRMIDRVSQMIRKFLMMRTTGSCPFRFNLKQQLDFTVHSNDLLLLQQQASLHGPVCSTRQMELWLRLRYYTLAVNLSAVFI